MTPRSDPPWWAYIQWGALLLSPAATIVLVILLCRWLR